jgi:hypothetical protein
MDIGYQVLVMVFYFDKPSDDLIPQKLFEEEETLIFFGLYTVDFIICMVLLTLLKMYAKKSKADEKRLKSYYLGS